MHQKNAITEIPPDTLGFYSNVFLTSSLSDAHYKLSAQYRQMRRLRVQNRSAGCTLSCTDTSKQQEVPSFCLRKQGMPVLSTSLQSEHCPSGIYSSGVHSLSLPQSLGDISNPISQRLVNTPPRL